MDKIIIFVLSFGFWVSCSTKPDYSVEIKTIDSLQTEVNRHLEGCRKMDTSWINRVTTHAHDVFTDVKAYYTPDSVIQEDVKLISYYKGYRKVGNTFRKGKRKLEDELELSLKQLKDLKTDAENGVLKKEELKMYIQEEKLVTTDLIYQFNDMKYSTAELLRNYDSLTPMIEKLVEVYKAENELTEEEKIRRRLENKNSK